MAVTYESDFVHLATVRDGKRPAPQPDRMTRDSHGDQIAECSCEGGTIHLVCFFAPVNEPRAAYLALACVLCVANQGDGTFAAPTVFLMEDYPQVMVTGDLNGDGRADLVVAMNPAFLTVLLAEPDGRFARPVLP